MKPDLVRVRLAFRQTFLGALWTSPWGNSKADGSHNYWTSARSSFGEAEFRHVIAAMVQDGADGLLISAAAENGPHGRLIVELAEKHRLVAIYPFAFYVKLGGLAAYSVDLAEIGSREAGYVQKLLQGAKPGELPYYMPTKLQLISNLKTAKTLGLTRRYGRGSLEKRDSCCACSGPLV